MKKAIKWILIILCCAVVLGSATMLLKTMKENVKEPEETDSMKPTSEIFGTYTFGETAWCGEFAQEVNFIYNNESFVGIRSSVLTYGDIPTTEFVRADDSVLVVQCSGNWVVDPSDIISFGTAAQLVNDGFKQWLDNSLVVYVSGDSEPEEPEEIYAIFGIYTFGNKAWYGYLDQDVNFTYDGESFVGIRTGSNNGLPTTEFVRADGSILVVQIMGLWFSNISQTVDFGSTPQMVNQTFKQWLDTSFAVSTYSISGVYTFRETASCLDVDQAVKFTYNGDEFVHIKSGVNEDGDPVTYFEYADGGYKLAQLIGVWHIDSSYTIDFGETPQTVSKSFKEWLDSSMMVYIPTEPDPEPEPEPTSVFLSKITLETLPKTSYVEGESFEVTNGVILCQYTDNTTKRVNLEVSHVYGWLEAFESGVGTHTLTIKYEENGVIAETTYQITIVAASVPDPDPDPDPDPEPDLEETHEISGVYTFRETASCSDVDQSVKFTYNGDEFVHIKSGVNEDGDPVTYFEYADGGYKLAQLIGVWHIDSSYTIDFGETPQTVSEEFLYWVTHSLIKQN